MKKLALVLALAVSGFVNGQTFNMKDIKHRPIEFSTNGSSFPVQLKEFDSIISLPVDESIKLELFEKFVNKRYGAVLGKRYSFYAIAICITNKDVAVEITDHNVTNPNSPDFFSNELRGTYSTCLGNIEKCFQMGILLQEVEEVMIIDNTPAVSTESVSGGFEHLIDYNK